MPPVIRLPHFAKHRFIKEIYLLPDQRERETDQRKDQLLISQNGQKVLVELLVLRLPPHMD